MQTIWNLDPSHSNVSFSIKHLMIAKVYGCFEKFTGTLVLDSEELTKSSVKASIETNSVNTRNEERDTHVRSVDFFDTEKFPLITFKSTSVSDKKIVGDITIHGITKPIELETEVTNEEIKDLSKNTKIRYSATTKIQLKDFGLTWNTALGGGGLLVGDEVSVMLDIQFVKQVIPIP
ncbi:MAG: YceI family protein [Bacteriovorax sp.]|nr:YceI family protein [Bacteriovorax sp.]